MTWKEFLNKTAAELASYFETDVQYSKFSTAKKRQLAWREIEIFIENYKQWGPGKLMLEENAKINPFDQDKLAEFLKKRRQSTPLAYVVGQQEFYGLNFKVDKNTLIPRPETEELVARALKFVSKHFLSDRRSLILIDVGTGSGCIIVSVTRHIPAGITKYRAYGIDISEKALKIAEGNAYKLLGYKNKIKFIKSSLLNFMKFEKIPASAFLVILANLPYLAEKEHKNTSGEVRNNEPKQALIGGRGGQELILKLIDQISELEYPGIAFLELSPVTFPTIKQYCATLGQTPGQAQRPLSIRKFTDINGNIRFITLKF